MTSENDHYFNLTGREIKFVDGVKGFDFMETNSVFEELTAYGKGILVAEVVNSLKLNNCSFLRNKASPSDPKNPLISLANANQGLTIENSRFEG